MKIFMFLLGVVFSFAHFLIKLFLVLQRFLWDACQDLTLIILMVAAVASLALGIKTEVC